jgi:signal transduction histidine kinase
MHNISDNELLIELKKRFQENKESLEELRTLTKQLEEVNRKLRESEAMKSSFISNIRNELINPLGSILGLSQQLAEPGHSETETASNIASNIYREAFDLDFILKNIFMAAEIEAGEAALNASCVHVSSLLEDVLSEFNHKMDEKDVTAKLSDEFGGAGREKPLFITDGEKLRLIMANLVSNAVKYSPEKGTVEVRLRKEDGSLEFLVRDYGIGIKESEKERIYDRFKQLDSGTTKYYRGQGLGLSITKALVEMLMGTIAFESSEGMGSTFVVIIPEADGDVESEVLAMNGNMFIFQEDEDANSEF